MFTGEERWCQLFSEPGAGSDFAGLGTRAVRDGDEWVVNGQKVWNTLAHLGDWGMLVARTDPDAAQAQGHDVLRCSTCSCRGVEVRPLRQITGEAEFNEVYMTDARVPDAHRIGAVGEGWRVALTTLMNERIGDRRRRRRRPAQRARSPTRCQIWKDLPDRRSRPARRGLADAAVLHRPRRSASRTSAPRPAAKAGNPGPEGVDRQAGDQPSSTRSVHRVLRSTCSAPTAMVGYDYTFRRPDNLSVDGMETRHPPLRFLRARANSIEGGTTRDHAQHPRRAGARPAGRTPGRQGPPLEQGAAQLT